MNWQTTNPTSPNKLNHQQLPAIQLKQSGPRTSARFGRLLVWSLIGLGVVAMTTVGGNSWRARAQTNRFVSIGGDDQGGTNDCTTPDQPCATIQHAIEKSGSGDLIVVGPGTYVENVSVTVSVTIQGDGSASSMVDGNAAGPVFTINEGVTATLTQLTITNGNAQGSQSQFGGGVQNLLGANTTIVGCTINDNDATAGGSGTFGGGIGNLGTLTVINSTISGNSAPSGGGIANGSGGSTATATVVNSTIALNSATTGGGVDNKDTLNLTNTVIAGSVAGGDCVNSGTLATNLNNLIQDGSCSPAVSGNPKLGMLQNNGGPTFTHALLTGSP
ncbi:MAG TPA: choice-of-anchor Q domain-containing protein, partial [Blastocatellia bacterium]|nr:choice-of-anchor Q domain-containing protein [Blastocatellia bacterium]